MTASILAASNHAMLGHAHSFLPEETKNRLLSLYRRAQSNLQEAIADRAPAQAFR